MKITVTYEHTFSPYRLYSPKAREIDAILWDTIGELPDELFDRLNDELGKYEARYRKRRYKVSQYS